MVFMLLISSLSTVMGMLVNIIAPEVAFHLISFDFLDEESCKICFSIQLVQDCCMTLAIWGGWIHDLEMHHSLQGCLLHSPSIVDDFLLHNGSSLFRDRLIL
ncbi:hypothetical protein BDZ97DRAFT_228170 [Flammula alnicola]|nr:hypothetical protein BDZ97DRAFT_228170 [Flammula alnicola]